MCDVECGCDAPAWFAGHLPVELWEVADVHKRLAAYPDAKPIKCGKCGGVYCPPVK